MNTQQLSRQLCAKYMPRQHSKKFITFRKAFQARFNLTDRDYRKLVVGLSKTVEQQMTAKKWDQIIYKSVPSVAMNKYRKAFYRNDEDRFKTFIEQVTKGETTIKAGAIFPHDLYKAIKKGDNAKAVEAQWNALPNYLQGSTEKILPVCDVSGSMAGDPIAISVALGIYLSERNESIFKDGFITFSARPQLQYLKGTFSQKVKQLENADWDMNTNLQAVFDLVLTKASEQKLPVEQMPTTILVISDMEFDSGYVQKPNYDILKEKYINAGYQVPKLVFWNVSGRVGNLPVKKTTEGVALVSGASPSIVKSVLTAELSPMKVLLDTLNNPRYKPVTL